MPGGIDFYTKLLLHQDSGTTTIKDSSFMSRTITPVNHATGDSTQYKFGGASLKLDGTDDYCTAVDDTDFAFGTGNFTIDFWAYIANLTNEMVFAGQYVDANNYWYVEKGTAAGGNKLKMEFKATSVKGSYVMTSAWSGAAITTWYHIAFVRNGTTGLIFINGVSQPLTETTAFAANDVGDLASTLRIGAYNASLYVNGWLDEFRISKGIARWTAGFTAPYRSYTNDPLAYTYGSFTPLRSTHPKVTVFTRKRFYHEILYSAISPVAANSHGTFRIIIKDTYQTLEKDFDDYEPIWIGGKFGIKTGRMIRGIVERTMPIRFKGGQWALEVQGRSFSAYAEIRKTTAITTASSKTIEQIINDYVKPYLPELDFVYISSPSIGVLSSYTMLNGRTYWDILVELAGLASTPNQVWGVWSCNGEHYGETKPGIHFGPIKDEIGYSLIPVSTMRVFDLLAPKDSSQVFTEAIIGYNNAGIIAYQTTDARGPGELSVYSGNFNGTTAYVTVVPVGDDLSFTTGESFSLEAWVYPTNVGAGTRTIMVKGRLAAATTENYNLSIVATAVVFEYRNSANTRYDTYTVSSPTLLVNTWNHIIITHTMGTGSSTKVYINGSLATGAWDGTSSGNDAPSEPAGNLYLGATSVTGTPANFFAGYMDDVRIYSGTLTALEALQHFKGTYLKGKHLFYMDFEEGTGNPNDKSGMGATGTLTNMTYFNYGQLPNSWARFGVVPKYFDRSWAGTAEATAFAKQMLRLYRQPVRYVDTSIPVDGRFRSGQYVYITDKSFRGRAMLDQVNHIFSDDPYTELTLLFM